MRTAPKLMSTVAAAAILFGLTGMASVANAEEASPAGSTAILAAPDQAPASAGAQAATVTEAAPTQVDDEVTAQGTRQFTVTNLSSHTLTLKRAWGTTGWPQMKETGFDLQDSAPMPGSVLKPGGQMKFEVRDWSNHGINAQFKAENGQDAYVYMHVSSLTRYSDAQGLAGQFNKGGSSIEILDAPGSVVTIPAGDTAAQTEAINNLCDKSGVKCTFTPKIKVGGPGEAQVLGARHAFGRGVANMTGEMQESHFSDSDTVGTSDSIEISASVKATILGSVESSLTTTYGHTWSTSHTFTQSEDLKIPAYHVGWLEAAEPVVRVTGDITIKAQNTTWTLQGVTFELPDTSPAHHGMIYKRTRELTPEELGEASKSAGFVTRPWNNSPVGALIETTTSSGDVIDIDGVNVPA